MDKVQKHNSFKTDSCLAVEPSPVHGDRQLNERPSDLQGTLIY
jgi:hypothetical protein